MLFFKYCTSITLYHSASQLCGSKVDSYTRGQGTESWVSQILCLTQPLWQFTPYTELLFQSCIFVRKSITVHQSLVILKVALISISRHKFIRPSHQYYRLLEIKIQYFKVDLNGVTSYQISSTFVQWFSSLIMRTDGRRDRHDQPQIHSFRAHPAHKA